MSSILHSIARLNAALVENGLKSPTILLDNSEEGMRFCSLVRQTPAWSAIIGSPDIGLRNVYMSDRSVWKECAVMGIAVRWPAKRIELNDGTWAWV